jgi:hypothetical protein
MTICLVRKMASFDRVHQKQDAHLVSCQQPLFSSCSLSLSRWTTHLYPTICTAKRIRWHFKTHSFLVCVLSQNLHLHYSHAKFLLDPHKIVLLHYNPLGNDRVSWRIYGSHRLVFLDRTRTLCEENALFLKAKFPRLKYILTWTQSRFIGYTNLQFAQKVKERSF